MNRILLYAAFLLVAFNAHAEPLADLQNGQVGRIEFNSLTPANRWDFVRKRQATVKPAVVYGDLVLPPATTGKIPAMVISHGSGGVSNKLFELWGNRLNAAGIAVFVVDSFKPRGIVETDQDQTQLDVSANAADALFALKLLATHPRIDPARIFHMGGSRGGSTAFETYWDMVRNAADLGTLRFAGNIPMYQGSCNTRYRYERGDTNRAPMLALLGGVDNGTPADACIAYYSELKQAGVNISWKVYPDAHHGFDGTGSYQWLGRGTTAKNCHNEAVMTDIPASGLKEARDWKTGERIADFADWSKRQKACNEHGYAIAGNATAREQAVIDVIDFVKSH